MTIPSSSIDTLADEIFNKIRAYSPESKLKKVLNAYDFAKQAHQGQLRKSGEPYLIHPLRTVEILTNLRVDEDTIVAALLHDVPEDTQVSVADIEKQFGKKIAYLVDGITKLAKVHYRENMQQRQIESLKKLFIHSAEDLRVILIKLADRLDNMRTLRFITDEKKRSRIARETLEIYVPIANLLWIGEIRMEIENLCFEHLYPLDYTNLKREVEENIEERNFILEEMIRLTEKELIKNHIESEIVGRPKTFYSIFRKLQQKQTIYNIDDLIAIRIIVPTRKDCYEVMGLIHRLFKPKPGCVKDYVAVPKPNGYQSLHTTVFGLNSTVVEFQVRTRYMHLEAEYGIAAHYFYKYSDEEELATVLHQRSTWIQRILELQKDHQDSTEDFLEDLKLDIFQDRIFVFSPKGDVIDLPKDACTLDFAYAIHSDIGNHATKAEINGVLLPVTTPLSSGNTVRIITDKGTIPEREWLNFVKTSAASTRIKDFLKKEPKEKKHAVGKRLIQKEFERMGKNVLDELSPKKLAIISKKFPYKTLDEILVAVGEGSLTTKAIMDTLFENKQLETGGLGYLIKKRYEIKSSFMSRVGLRIIGDNSKNQFREITRTLNALHIPIVKFIVDKPWYTNGLHRCTLSIMVRNYNELSQVFETLEQIDDVKSITRRFIGRKIWFFIASTLTALLWISYPVVINSTITKFPATSVLSNIIIYVGVLMLFGLVFYLKNMTRRSFPELAETAYYWPILYTLNTFALVIIVSESLFLNLDLNLVFVIGLIIGVYTLLTANYIRYHREQLSQHD